MEIDFSKFGEVPRTVSTILKLLRTSLREVNNIVNVVNGGGEDRRVALDRTSFRGAEFALLPYKELLTNDYRACRSASIDKTFEEFKSGWSQLVQSVGKALPAKKETQQFAAAWHKATDALCDILEGKKKRSKGSTRIYKNLVVSLDKVATLMKKHAPAHAISHLGSIDRQIKNLSRNQLKNLKITRDIKKQLDYDEDATDHDNEVEFTPDFKGKDDESLLTKAWNSVHSDNKKGERQSICFRIYRGKHQKATINDKAFKSFYQAIMYQLRRETTHSKP